MPECRFALHVMIRPRVVERLSPSGLDRKWLRYSRGANFLLVINATYHVASHWIYLWSIRFVWQSTTSRPTASPSPPAADFECVNTRLSSVYVTFVAPDLEVPPRETGKKSGQLGSCVMKSTSLAEPGICVCLRLLCQPPTPRSRRLQACVVVFFWRTSKSLLCRRRKGGGDPPRTPALAPELAHWSHNVWLFGLISEKPNKRWML